MAIDVDQIKALIELMVGNDLSRLELRDGETHILMRRGQPVIATGLAPVPASVMPAASPAAVATQPSGTPPAAAAPASNEVIIRSPMVGTFYVSAEPGAAPFVQPGSVVNPNTIVCLIEAMKVFNEIKAEVSGRVSRVLVRNAEAVEFDQPLFAIEPA